MKNFKSILAICVCSIFLFSGCGTFKNVANTINDAATILCNLFAAEQSEDALGMSPQDWCAVHENLAPFIDEATKAKRQAGKTLGMGTE